MIPESLSGVFEVGRTVFPPAGRPALPQPYHSDYYFSFEGETLVTPHFTVDAANGSVVAVVVGAFLATISGYIGNQIENRNRSRDKERGAALLFGEILVGIKVTLELADVTRGRGDPYSPVTMRMVRAVQRETQSYDRNREALFDIRDPKVRAQIHILMARLIIALDGVTDANKEIISTETTMRLRCQSDSSYGEFAAQRDLYVQDRAQSFDFAIELLQEIPPVLAKLRKIARYSFEAHESVVRSTVTQQVVGDP
jgi:hypothetical protein